MRKQDEYRKNAADTVKLASRSDNSADKSHLLRLAEKWVDLADRTARLSARFGPKRPDHPLVRKRLGSRPADANGRTAPESD